MHEFQPFQPGLTLSFDCPRGGDLTTIVNALRRRVDEYSRLNMPEHAAEMHRLHALLVFGIMAMDRAEVQPVVITRGAHIPTLELEDANRDRDS